MKTNFDRIAKLASVAAVSGLISASSAMAEGTLKLGMLVAKSGPFVSLSETNAIAAQISIDEINAAGGINGKQIEVIEFDTAGNPGQAVIGLRRLAEDEHVLAVIGPFSSSECKVAFPQAERAGVVSMSMASSAPKLAEPFSFAFRNTTNEGLLISRAVASLKTLDPDASTAAIAHATDDAISVIVGTKILPVVLGKAGFEMADSVTFKYAAFDLSVQVSQMVAAATDVVAVGAPPEAAIKLAKEMRRQGHNGRLVAGSTVFDVNLPTRMGKDGDGSIFPTTFYWDLNEETKAFSAEFAKRTTAEGMSHSIPAQFDASAYDIVKLFAHAMIQGGVTGDSGNLEAERIAIRDQLAMIKDFPTIEGLITIGADGDAVKPIYVMEIRDKAWHLISTYK